MVERIRQLLQDKQLTPTQFADAIGIARPIVSHILSGRNKPSLEVVQKILAAFTDLSMPWLLNGSGPMWTVEAVTRAAAAPVPATPVAVATSASKNPPSTAPVQTTAGADGENTLPPKARRSQPEPLTGNPDASAPASLRPHSKVLPPLRRFQAARSGSPEAGATEIKPGIAPGPEAGAVPAPALAPPAAGAPLPTPAAAGATATPAEAAAFLLQPGKAIRRIVIFYQDGSFADYQPE